MMTCQIRQLQSWFEFCKEKRDITGFNRIWTCNHTAVASKCEVKRQETTETLILLKITYINLKRMMLSYVSGFQHLQKQKTNIILLLVKENNWYYEIMKFTCLKLSFPLFRRSWEHRRLLTQSVTPHKSRCL